jgi:hypothetical protein
MHKITYKVNGGSATNTVYATILDDKETELLVSINNEVERVIKKEKIIKNEVVTRTQC